MELNAFQDDFDLNALGDTERGDYALIITALYYLTDPSGNRLTDPDGNYLVAPEMTSAAPQILTSLPDDFELNAE